MVITNNVYAYLKEYIIYVHDDCRDDLKKCYYTDPRDIAINCIQLTACRRHQHVRFFQSFIYTQVTFSCAFYGLVRPRLQALSTPFTLFIHCWLFFLFSSTSHWQIYCTCYLFWTWLFQRSRIAFNIISMPPTPASCRIFSFVFFSDHPCFTSYSHFPAFIFLYLNLVNLV